MLSRLMFLCAFLVFSAPSRAGVLAQFQLEFGTVDVELFEQDKPETVRNFLAYANSGYWNPSIMHRWVQNFVIQGGSYHLSPTGIVAVPTFPPVTNEFSVGRTYSNL